MRLLDLAHLREMASKMINRSSLLKLRIIAASLAVLFGAGTVAAYAGEAKIEQCLDPETCPIPYVRLAKQETEPFLFRGKIVDRDHPHYKHYGKALRRFPDVQSCLIEDQREKPQPALRQIDWDQIETAQEIDICVFRIAASIDDVKLTKAWLLYHGFRLGETGWSRPPNYSPEYETEPTFGFAAYLTVEQFREIIPQSWFARMIGFEGLRGYSLTILFSSSGAVVDVTSGGGTIFN
jgi:hypothetical protein